MNFTNFDISFRLKDYLLVADPEELLPVMKNKLDNYLKSRKIWSKSDDSSKFFAEFLSQHFATVHRERKSSQPSSSKGDRKNVKTMVVVGSGICFFSFLVLILFSICFHLHPSSPSNHLHSTSVFLSSSRLFSLVW